MPHSYEDYDIKSKTYTSLRHAVGINKQLEHFKKNKVPLDHQKLLDAGCGTGNYMLHYLNKMGSIHCSDYNEGMLNEAKKNFSASGVATKNIRFTKDSIIDMIAMKDCAYDAICNNQVIHHLRSDNDFEDLRNTTKEFYRVLKPGGRLVINWSPFDSCWQGFYYVQLIPDAFNKWLPRCPTRMKMVEVLQAAGFEDIVMEPLLDEILMKPEYYLEPRNFLDIHRFKLGDSVFNLATDDELKKAVAKVQAMEKEGSLDDWFKKKNEDRLKVGQSVNFYAVKKKQSKRKRN